MKRIIVAVSVLVVLGGAFAIIQLSMPAWYARWWYPLNNADTVRTNAGRYHLEPDLVAAVIYQESDFKEDSTSRSGAVGMMQLMPETAAWIASKTGDQPPSRDDLKSPATNIRYGCWYLRYLLDRYGGSESLALAAYNGGSENVDRWLATARASGRKFNSAVDIPYPETREYITSVDKVKLIYQRAYGADLELQ